MLLPFGVVGRDCTGCGEDGGLAGGSYHLLDLHDYHQLVSCYPGFHGELFKLLEEQGSVLEVILP